MRMEREEMEDGVVLCLSALVCLWLVRACLLSCALLVRAGACFVLGSNGHLLAWVLQTR
jgi:hypothetical protein